MSLTMLFSASPVFNYLTLSLVSVCLFFAGNYLYTSFRFKRDLHNFRNAKSGESLPPPKIPSVIPWLGLAPSFLTTKPLGFWSQLFGWYPQDVGACALTMGGQTLNVIFNASATQHIMKDRKLGRDKFTEQVVVNGLGLSAEECERVNEFHKVLKPGEISANVQQERLNTEYLIKTERVNELTAEFLRVVRAQVAHDFADGPGEVNLYQWMRKLMFHASTTALWGDRILEAIPDFEDLFFVFDKDMLSMFYGLPDFLISRQVSNRNKILDKLVGWYKIAEKETGGIIADPDTVAWDPVYGSRFSRSRQLFCRERGMTRRSTAGIELGSLFGLSSNAIPATGWMLFYILDSKRSTEKPTLYDQIMVEIEASKSKNGTISVPLLVTQPILQSTLHEVLRMYVDVLVARQIDRDMSLPLTPEDSKSPRYLSLKANTMLMIPSYPAHNDPVTWQSPEFPHHPPASTFYPYRFLTADPSDPSQKPVFTTAHTAGKFFPFGGGKTMCPGRTFAKQEMLASVATWLSTFDFEVLNYLDGKGKVSKKFPGLRDSLPGSALMVPGGDMRVRVSRR